MDPQVALHDEQLARESERVRIDDDIRDPGFRQDVFHANEHVRRPPGVTVTLASHLPLLSRDDERTVTFARGGLALNVAEVVLLQSREKPFGISVLEVKTPSGSPFPRQTIAGA